MFGESNLGVAIFSARIDDCQIINRPCRKEISSSNHRFSGAMLVAGRVNQHSIM